MQTELVIFWSIEDFHIIILVETISEMIRTSCKWLSLYNHVKTVLNRLLSIREIDTNACCLMPGITRSLEFFSCVIHTKQSTYCQFLKITPAQYHVAFCGGKKLVQ